MEVYHIPIGCLRTKWECSHSKGRGTNNTLVLLFFFTTY
nr:MAG TPA: hypothetical protein [Crassvirales sp.]